MIEKLAWSVTKKQKKKKKKERENKVVTRLSWVPVCKGEPLIVGFNIDNTGC